MADLSTLPKAKQAASQGLARLTATEGIALVKSKKISVMAWTEACLERIQAIDEAIKAWEFLAPELAMAQASILDEKIQQGQTLGQLWGAPVGIKDIFNTKDMPTQMGSKIWENFTPGNDARVVHYLRMQDAVVLGKTVTAEFAVHTPGPTGNPHNVEYMSGTSSSGSAAAVAASMAPIALGTQTAGSTIRPASYCGVYGFKPSFGLLPRTGMLKTTDSLDTIGLFARCVEDLALLFDITRVHGLDFPISHAALSNPARQTKRTGNWRVGFVKGPKWNLTRDYAQEAITDYAARLGKISGVVVEEVPSLSSLNEAHRVHQTIYDYTLAYYFKEEFKKHTLISSVMYEIIENGNRITLSKYKEAIEDQARLARELDMVFNNYDILLNLSTAGEALKGLDSIDIPDNCLIWTLCGVPAINLPVFKGPTNLPFGAQILARRYNDYLVLNFIRFLKEKGFVKDGTYPTIA